MAISATAILLPSLLMLVVQLQSTNAQVGCGYQSSYYTPNLPIAKKRIINGQNAKPHSWPWAVFQSNNGNAFCGGTLLRVRDDLEESDIVLTAAHCVGVGKTNDPSNYYGWTVTAGGHTRSIPEAGQQTRNVIKAVYHESYVPVKNDIALVLLDRPIKFSDTIRPPCLPYAGETPPIGRTCVVAGWGRNDSNYQFLIADTLQQSVQPVHDGNVCKRVWLGTYDEDLMICVGVLDGTSGACNGDSGGPLTCRADDGRWVQYGVVSFVTSNGRCVASGWPSAFTRVGTYVDWIRTNIQQLTRL